VSASDPLGPVTIGAREIYDKLLDLNLKVDRIAATLSDVQGTITDHEARLRTLERGRWPLPSIAALVSVGSLAIALISLFQGG